MTARVFGKTAFLAWGMVIACILAGCGPAEEQEGVPSLEPVQVQRGERVNAKISRDEYFIPSRLLTSDSVQQDLNLTDEQKAKVAEFKQCAKLFLRETAEIWRDNPRAGRTEPMSEAQGQAMVIRMRDMTAITKKLKTEVVGLLTPSQRERLRQIELQYTLAISLSQPSLVQSLGISDEQLVPIRQYAQACALAQPQILDGLGIPEAELAKILPSSDVLENRDAAKLMSFDGLSADEIFKRMIELTKVDYGKYAEANQAALQVLTPEQRTKLDALMGKHLDLTWNLDEFLQ